MKPNQISETGSPTKYEVRVFPGSVLINPLYYLIEPGSAQCVGSQTCIDVMANICKCAMILALVVCWDVWSQSSVGWALLDNSRL